MYGKMQASRVTEIIFFHMHLSYPGQYLVFFSDPTLPQGSL